MLPAIPFCIFSPGGMASPLKKKHIPVWIWPQLHNLWRISCYKLPAPGDHDTPCTKVMWTMPRLCNHANSARTIRSHIKETISEKRMYSNPLFKQLLNGDCQHVSSCKTSVFRTTLLHALLAQWVILRMNVCGKSPNTFLICPRLSLSTYTDFYRNENGSNLFICQSATHRHDSRVDRKCIFMNRADRHLELAP